MDDSAPPACDVYRGRARVVRRVGAIDWLAEIVEPAVEGSAQAHEPVLAISLAIEAAVGYPVRLRVLEIVDHGRTWSPPVIVQQELRFEADVLRDATICPDCGGAGRYVGLRVVEICAACGGSGWAR